VAPPVWATWGQARPHLYAVERTARPFSAVPALLNGRAWEAGFAVTTLRVSQRLGGRYVARLAQPLAADTFLVPATDPEYTPG